MSEKWLPVPGYEGLYEVSALGCVRSLGRIIQVGNETRRKFGSVLHLSRDGKASDGRYMYVGLSKDGVSKRCFVHRLVLEAFVGPCPEGMEALHGEGGSEDNRLVNLKWDTRAENNRDLVRQGRHHYAKRTHCDSGHLLKPRRHGNKMTRYCPTCQNEAARLRRATA